MLAWVRGEPAAAAVDRFLRDADSAATSLVMSWINIAETFYILWKRSSPSAAEEFLKRMPSFPIRTVVPDAPAIEAAARIKALHPVAFGDAFAIALAQAENASVITGDEEIRKCAVVPVDWVGR